MEKNNHARIIEMERFLQHESSYGNNEKYYLTNRKSIEIVALNASCNSFKARQLEHPVSAGATLMHLLKSCFGTGILAMPFAFKCSGLVVGVVATIFASVICTHSAYVLVKCAHDLYRRTGKISFSYADVAEEACLSGPPWAKHYSSVARRFVDIATFITYFGSCSAYTVIIAKNFDKVTTFYWGPIDIRIYLIILLIPHLLLIFVPNLKYFAPVSTVSNILMAAGILLTCYYLVNNLPSLDQRKMAADISNFPTFFSITIFALEAIGIVMPLENNMNKPEKFVGIFGVLNIGMAVVTMVYVFLGFLGYLRFGEQTAANVTLNLPSDEYAAQAIQILIGIAIYGTFGLPFFVAMEIVWKRIKHRYEENPTLANYIVRTVLLLLMFLMAIAVPSISPFIGLIGALCFSLLGIVMPIVLEIITFWDKGFGAYNWKVIKNIVVVSTGLFAMIFGTKAAVIEIVEMYS